MGRLEDRSFFENHPVLQTIFKEHWDTKLIDYAEALFRTNNSSFLEPQLISAIKKSLKSQKFSDSEIHEITKSFQTLNTLQTSHHITPTNGPGFNCIDLISLSGLPKQHYYIVGAFSGVPFSNAAWSGSISYSTAELKNILKPDSILFKRTVKSQGESEKHGNFQKKVSLIPSKYRDSLVYSFKCAELAYFEKESFSDELQDLFCSINKFELYSHWAADFCSAIQRKAFQNEKIIYFDLNHCIKNYLIEVLKNEDHLIHKLFFEKKTSDSFFSIFKDTPIFRFVKRGKKSHKIKPAFWESGKLKSEGQFQAESSEELIALLVENLICPGQWLIFFILVFINKINCLGSFNQIEYLQDYFKKLSTLPDKFSKHFVKPQNSLTTGRLMLNDAELWPLDLFLREEVIDIKDFFDFPMSYFWSPIKDTLIKRLK